MSEIVSAMPGYAGHKVFRAEDGELVVVAEWRDKAAFAAWDEHPDHKRAKELGKAYLLDAFDSGDAGPLGYVEEGALRLVRDWPAVPADRSSFAIDEIADGEAWPRVEIVMNYAGAGAAMVDALLAQAAAGSSGVPPLRGLVVAGTGNGSVHEALQAALLRASAAGVAVVRASRCPRGRVLPRRDDVFPDSRGLSALKARIALTLQLMR